MQRWEYKVIDITYQTQMPPGREADERKADQKRAVEDMLAGYGKDGWEIVSVNFVAYEGTKSDGFVGWLKRPIVDAP